MKLRANLAFVALMYSATSFATGGTTIPNGGDPNEPIFKEIATNIQQWIMVGNADSLRLPQKISLDAYKSKMLEALGNYSISFTTNKVTVGNYEKTCANSIDASGKRNIICNSDRFASAHKNNINYIYRTIHHEFAGLAGLEPNSGEDSNYTISEQISGYLNWEYVKRLPVVKNPDRTMMPFQSSHFCVCRYEKSERNYILVRVDLLPAGKFETVLSNTVGYSCDTYKKNEPVCN